MPATVGYPNPGDVGSRDYVGSLDKSNITTGTEIVIGGLVFDGSLVQAGKNVYFRWVGSVTDPDVTSVGTVLLYDLGPESGPEVAPVLRSTLTIDASTADEGKILRKQALLTLSGSPAASSDEIFNTARLYQLRQHMTASAGSEIMSILKSSLVVA